MKPQMNRREFSQLTAAALGGLMTGSMMSSNLFADEHNPKLLLEEPHVCRGLNTCKNKGKGGENACAGQGTCATAKSHACKGENACKGQGGCGEHPGQNACKGQGACAVPIEKEAVWKRARSAFEEQMKQAGKKVGPAPKGA